MFDKASRIAHLHLDGMRVGRPETLVDCGELSLEFGNFRSDCRRVSVAKSAELVCNPALQFRGLATQVRIALLPRGHGLAEFFLETVQRVIYDHWMQYSFLQPGEELALEIQSANQQTIRANAVAALRMH